MKNARGCSDPACSASETPGCGLSSYPFPVYLLTPRSNWMKSITSFEEILQVMIILLLRERSCCRDGGGKSFSNKKCEKRAEAGERQGIFPAATAPFPKSCASYFRFARFNTFPLYNLRAWHRLDSRDYLSYQQHRTRTLLTISSESCLWCCRFCRWER